jgi:TRAP-type C4-dicarboxylate transport system permease small subunit
MKREGTPVLGIPFMWVFLPFVLLLVSMVLRFGWIAWQAIRGRDGEL